MKAPLAGYSLYAAAWVFSQFVDCAESLSPLPVPLILKRSFTSKRCMQDRSARCGRICLTVNLPGNTIRRWVVSAISSSLCYRAASSFFMSKILLQDVLGTYAECCRSRTISTIWACRKEMRDSNECLGQ